jgi:hypothetical protein
MELRRSSKFERSLTKAGPFLYWNIFYILRKWASLVPEKLAEKAMFDYVMLEEK